MNFFRALGRFFGGLFSFFRPSGENQDELQLLLQYGTMKFVGRDAKRAARITETIDEILDVAENEYASAEHLLLELPLDKLDPADRLAAQRLAEMAIEGVRARAGVSTTMELPLEDLELVLGWVRDAAVLAAGHARR